ncbi:MAG: tRNA (adenosine(37)-N6)-dimethylallyltransferase MiaA [Gammaproteobacteria bacterium]|nr:tRNA (adenosine(37)-N6)-dimethylallyltransferase MiaA [Gammaproteobacteria bacterium]MCH9716020.1 tRNA (adenosine(37)-N6)-dimethylallyltransferase MiaA [Gammaproteobacteria bacterium]MCH9763581.1 tRNA (adenosine(37)-N6)-dimethylallyltransferase MiaA [Gammaproteobacteria bacterium]
MGPTASGKTDMACALLQAFPCEIISVDSAMVYRGMDIGTAKPDSALLALAPHHLIDIRDPTEPYSVAAFCEDAQALCDDILARGHTPLLVGGSMMYFRAFKNGLSALPAADPVLRQTLLLEAKEKGWPYLHQKLQALDNITAERLHPNDAQRIQRALEVFYTTGKPLSEVLNHDASARSACTARYCFIELILYPERRAWLHERIGKRFEQMLSMGFLDEVTKLKQRFELTPDMPAMRSVGYRQALDYQADQCDFKTFCERGVAATRQLAKRQLTWLRTWPNAYRFDPENAKCFDAVLELLHLILDNQASQSEDLSWQT